MDWAFAIALIVTLVMVVYLVWIFLNRPFWAVGGALAVVVVSLAISYCWPGFKFVNAYGRVGGIPIGAIVELLRHLIYAMIFLRVLGSQFREEMKILLSLDGPGPWWFARAGLVAVTLLALWATTKYHVSEGPKQLFVRQMQIGSHSPDADKQRAEPEANWENLSAGARTNFVWPYVWYLPQSLIQYLFWAPLLFVIPIAAAVEDWCKSETRIRDAVTITDDSSLQESFLKFRARTDALLAKYIEVPVLMASVLGFELLVGRHTLSVDAMKFQMLEVALISSVGLMFLFAAVQYQRFYSRVAGGILVEESAWLAKCTPWDVVLAAAKNSVAFAALTVFGTSYLSWVLSKLFVQPPGSG